MPIRPCVACGVATTRLLDEASRHSIVWYYRCDACGHVWALHKDNGQVHHVTPLERPETERAPGQTAEPFAPMSSHDVEVGFLRTEVEAGLTYTQLADSEMEPDLRQRQFQRANRSLEAVARFLSRVDLVPEERDELIEGMMRLQQAIAAHRERWHEG